VAPAWRAGARGAVGRDRNLERGVRGLNVHEPHPAPILRKVLSGTQACSRDASSSLDFPEMRDIRLTSPDSCARYEKPVPYFGTRQFTKCVRERARHPSCPVVGACSCPARRDRRSRTRGGKHQESDRYFHYWQARADSVERVPDQLSSASACHDRRADEQRKGPRSASSRKRRAPRGHHQYSKGNDSS